jgi:hypothetical protein
MSATITQVIEELIQIRQRAGDIEFEAVVNGEIVVENDGRQCFSTNNFRVVAVSRDGYPVLPSLVVTPIAK